MPTPISSLAQLFPNPTLVRVLSLFFLHPEERFYQRDLAERTQSALLQVQRALRRVELAGLIRKTREGNRVYYLAEQTHPAFDDLRRAFLKTVALADVLRQALLPVRRKVQLAFIYGSLAHGEEKARSDIDLFVIGGISLLEVSRALGGTQRALKRELNPAVYSLSEFHRRLKQKESFITDVTAGPKIWLIGDQNEFERLVG